MCFARWMSGKVCRIYLQDCDFLGNVSLFRFFGKKIENTLKEFAPCPIRQVKKIRFDWFMAGYVVGKFEINCRLKSI